MLLAENVEKRPPMRAQAGVRWGRWWASRRRRLRLLALLALTWSAAYAAWRVGWSWHRADAPLWAALLAAELYGVWNLGTLAWLTWELRAPLRPPAFAGREVDVYVCTYDEPIGVLEATLSGCALLRYPHTTWLLDDGARPEVERLAREWGVRYLTRPDRTHAKAGNINHALTRTDGELVFVLDADHVPMPDALDVLVGYLDDPRVALVQTPHDFSNHDSIQHYSLGRHEQSVFFSTICVGKERHNAAFWCGSGALIRRKALLSVGGVATETIAEDFHTTIKLHRQGWRTHYDQRIVAQGLAPHDLASYLLQRDRWARGNLAVFTTPESPLRARELTAAQRLSYLASLTGYLAGPVRLLLLGVLTVVLWSAELPLHISLFALAALWAPATILTTLAGSALCRGSQSSGEAIHYELCTAEIFTRALRCAVRPGRASFKVTPKEGIDRGGWSAIRQFRALNVFAVLLALGLVARLATSAFGAGLLPPMHGIAVWVVTLLASVELRRLLHTLVRVGRRRQLRGEYRVPLTATARVVPSEVALTGADGGHDPDATGDKAGANGARQALSGRMCDVTGTGVGFELSQPLAVGQRAALTVALPRVSGMPATTRLEIEVRSCVAHGSNWRIGAGIVGCRERDRRALLAYCHVIWPYLRLRGEQALGLQQLEHALDRPSQHGAIAAHDDRTLHQLRVGGHSGDQTLIGDGGAVQA
jgi:cellulose synthase (UDP-forming)